MSRITTTVAVITLAAVGCAGGPEGPGPAPERPIVQVHVENQNWADVTVYAISGAERRRLGTVVTSGAEVFRLPDTIANRRGQLRLLVDPIGGAQGHVTQPIIVAFGDEIRLNVQNHLALTSVTVAGLRRNR